ncbi:sodium:solute symporter family protein [Nitriliruptor alkaliphilus]|uniref:sodium:solute symporter family protein n=1 Tax=Nitriliruptor alkaliphilus TaxID=427918 RepID=UPI0006967B10|nr:sodium:solute symporter family protein [Nitriliruptor alkaliphilus]
MGILGWTIFWVIGTFGLYFTIAWRSRVSTTEGFYVAGKGIPAPANGAAIAADWMSAASFISMAGIVAFGGYDASFYLMGWTGGYVLLAVLLAPYLRKFGKFTVPDFFGDRYSSTARLVAALAAIFVSFTYVVGQMQGVGIVFGRFLNVNVSVGVMIGMGVVLFYAVLGGMKGITWVQVAQYTVLIIAYLIPAFAIASQIGNNPIPHLSFGAILQELDGLQEALGFAAYSAPFVNRSQLDVMLATASLMIGTAGLPHVIVRFYTAKSVRAARYSAFWALFFIALLYTTAPAIGVFAKTNLINDVSQSPVEQQEEWVRNWQDIGLITIDDKNGDGIVDYTPDPETNELTVSNDIIVLANPEIAGLPAWVVGLVAAGGLAAALSTAAGLLIVISSSVAHDVYFKRFRPQATEKQQLKVGRWAMAGAILIAGYFGISPPGFVAQVVAWAFGLAASSFFPAIVLGIFWKRFNARGAVAGLTVGISFTAFYIIATQYAGMGTWFGISAEGIGFIGALLNLAVAIPVALSSPPPSPQMQELIESIRYPGPPAREPVPEEV